MSYIGSSQPSQVGAEFLAWLRAVTEVRWASYIPRDSETAGVGGLDWAPGTHWRGGMTEAQIGVAERRFGLAFPPDYHRFLSTLHTTDPAMVGALYEGPILVPTTGRWLYDWLGDEEPIERALALPLDSLLQSIEADDWWHPAWGPSPGSPTQRAEVVRALAETGPPLIPVFGHRYLVGTPLVEGNPVLSMSGSDVIVYADNLESYLAMELAGQSSPKEHAVKSGHSARPIGFWQDVIDAE